MIMDNKSFRSIAWVWIAAGSLLGAGCGDDSTPPETADSTGGTPSGQTTGSTVSATGQNPTADTTAGVSTSMSDGGFLDPSSGDDGPPEPGPNGTPCDNNTACESEFCFVLPMLGGVCSECLMDTDCAEGTCSLDAAAAYAICTDGGIGVMCDSDKGCMDDLVCSEILDTAGLFPLDFCSECRDDVPCADGQLCSPVYDLANVAGFLGCVDPMSVPDGEGCPLVGGVGDGAVCMSGLCGVALLFDLIPVGVCGECLTDMDCPGGTCQPAAADMAGLMGATCI